MPSCHQVRPASGTLRPRGPGLVDLEFDRIDAARIQDFFLELRDAGRTTARRWLEANYDAIGTRATLDLRAEVS